MITHCNACMIAQSLYSVANMYTKTDGPFAKELNKKFKIFMILVYWYTFYQLYCTFILYIQYINPPTFGTFFIQVGAPFETIRYCGFEWCNNSVDSPNGFEW